MGTTAEQLLWVETLIKGTIGLCLVLSPKLVVRLFALPETPTGFWPRLTGGVLLGLAITIFLSGAQLITDGIGLGGLAIVNFSAATILLMQDLRPSPAPKRQRRTLLGWLALLLAGLAVLEIAAR
ncbi:MAG: hypothetical protein K0U34_08670 [Alphaproteobacteria bacterium]|nr:hypothetical protein [Alphaproteobacteria bacterium]